MIEEVDHLEVEYEGMVVNIISNKKSILIISKDTAIKLARSIIKNCTLSY